MNEKSNVINGNKKPKSLEGDIEFSNVSFAYPSRPSEVIINDISFKISKNKTTAIVGDSGSGKSTLINLIMRLYDPNKGNIYIDNSNIKDYDVKILHDKMAIVNQSPKLFDNTLYENIA